MGVPWPYVGTEVGPMLAHHVDKFYLTMLQHLQLVIFFRSRSSPPEPQNPRKTRGFFDSAKTKVGSPEGPKTP